MRRSLLFAVLSLSVLLSTFVAARAAGPNMCMVQANTPNSPTIQQAVDSGCSRIRVAPGIYTENVRIVDSRVVIEGVAGAEATMIDGGGRDTVFSIGATARVTLQGLTIRHGEAGNIDRVGGGILNYGAVTLAYCTVTANRARSIGGGIYNVAGTVRLEHSTVIANITEHAGGGICNDGGTVELSHSTVTAHSAGLVGGGIFNNDGGTVELSHSTVTTNRADQGGGIYNGEGSTLTLENSTVTANRAFGGGGIANGAGTVTLEHSTVTGNTPDDIYGVPAIAF